LDIPDGVFKNKVKTSQTLPPLYSLSASIPPSLSKHHLLHPENGGTMVLQIAGILPHHYTVS